MCEFLKEMRGKRPCACYHMRAERSFFVVYSLDVGTLVGISVAVVAAVLVIWLVLHFTVFASLRYKKQVYELSRRFEYLHALLFGQDSQYIKRIEYISRVNLLYVDQHVNFSKRFKDIRDKSDSAAQTAINNLKDLLAERNYKGLNTAIPEAKRVIDNYDEEVNALSSDLSAVIRPEEECRQAAASLKSNLRTIKQDFYIKQADLSLVFDSFDRVFARIDEEFTQFESLVESAKYEEAQEILPKLDAVIKELGRCLAELPGLCVTISSLIPDKLASLENRYAEMKAAEYPLHHLFVNESLIEMRSKLESISKHVQNFDIKDASLQLDEILSRIDYLFDEFDKEKDARTVFESGYEQAYAKNKAVDNKYIAICNALPEVKALYLIPAEGQAQIDNINGIINKMGATKRSLDTLIHSGVTTPYTLLMEKMKLMEEETDQATAAIDDFQRYLVSLKDDTMAAYEAVDVYFKRVHEAEYKLRRLDVGAAIEKHQKEIEDCRDLISKIHTALYTKPIDVTQINEYLSSLRIIGDNLFLAVSSEDQTAVFASNTILYANRSRQHLGEVHEALNQSETFYFEGDFQAAYESADACLKRLGGNG